MEGIQWTIADVTQQVDERLKLMDARTLSKLDW
jgi:hypothetical protein